MNFIELLNQKISFCKNNSNYTIGIFINSFKKLEFIKNVISDIISNSKDLNFLVFPIINKNEIILRFKNGSSIRVMIIKDKRIGYKFNSGIIDNEIKMDIINNIICPCIIKNSFSSLYSFNTKIYYVDINFNKENK